MNEAVSRMPWLVMAVLCGWLGLACAPEMADEPGEEQAPAPAVSPAALTGASSYIDIRLRTGSGVSIGSTCGAANEVTPTCGGSSASDFNHYWIAPYDGAFTFSTLGGGTLFNTVLQVTDWASGTPLGCNDDASGSQQSSVTVNLAAGQEIRVTVDGKGWACGRFQLNIVGAKSACGPCNTPPTSCYARDGACMGTTCVYSLKAAGAACDDGNACTVGDSCNGSGTCQSTPMVCDKPGTCQQSGGKCVNGTCQYAPSPSGTPCDDGNVCTLDDMCDGQGYCSFNGYRDCSFHGGYCSYGDCDMKLGCVTRQCPAGMCEAGYWWLGSSAVLTREGGQFADFPTQNALKVSGSLHQQ